LPNQRSRCPSDTATSLPTHIPSASELGWPPRHDFHLKRQLPSGFLLDDGKPDVFRVRSRFEEIAIHFLEARLNEAASRQTLSRV
jgi:hypothetical protein